MEGTVVNGLPHRVIEVKPGFSDAYEIPERDPELGFSIAHIRDANYLIYIGNGENMEYPIAGYDVAMSICRDYGLSLPETDTEVHPMLFAIEGLHDVEDIIEKSDIMLNAARDRHMQWLRRLVMAADNDWAQMQNHIMISDLQRFAAKELGLEREWMTVVESGLLCPACKTAHKPGQVICANCRFVLDRETYKTMMFAAD